MNELRGKYINVVLGVEEGRGMDFLKNPVYILAHFNGRIMESDCTNPTPCPDFNTELVWETEKKVIRNVRSTNSPLRVECYTIEDKMKKECVGFTLLSLRSANIIPASRPELAIPVKWHKLIGVPPSYKKYHPELNLSLTLRDHHFNTSMPPAIPVFEPETINKEKQIIPVKFIDDGYIQVGGDESNEKYELKLIVKIANNLDVLLPKDLVFQPNTEKFFLAFQMFGIHVNTKPFYRDLHETIVLNEHIVVKLQSSLDILKIFFEEFHEITINFCHGFKVLGTTKLNMAKLIPSKIQSQEFKNYYNGKISRESICYFTSEEPLNPIYESLLDRKPEIAVEILLNTEMDRIRKVFEKEVFLEPIDHQPDFCGSGDAPVDIKPFVETQIEKIPPLEFEEDGVIDTESYQQYSLDIILESLIWRYPINQTKFHVKFKHPRASTYLLIKSEIDNSLSTNILLESLHCKFVYISTSTQISKLLEAWPPKFIIEDTAGIVVCEEFTVCTEDLLDKPNYENSYSDLLKKVSGEVIADIKLWMCVQECGIKALPIHDYELTPRILDEHLTIKELCDLESWKQGVEAKFQQELKTKERLRINALAQGWIERKNNLESKLLSNVNRCKKLAKDLKRSSNRLKIQKAVQEKQKSTTLDTIHEEIRKNAVKYSLTDNYELIENISNVEMENEYLKQMLAEQTIEIEAIKKCSLSNEQTANLLQDVRHLEEKYMEALKVKNYFKEQYARAVKEIHELKTEGHKNITNQLQIKKEELSQLSLDKFFDIQNTETFEYSEQMLNSDIFEEKCAFSNNDCMSESSTIKNE